MDIRVTCAAVLVAMGVSTMGTAASDREEVSTAPRVSLTASIQREAALNSHLLTQDLRTEKHHTSRRACVARTVAGGGIGAFGGLGMAWWLLESTGGSDEAPQIVRSFMIGGAVAGTVIGMANCLR